MPKFTLLSQFTISVWSAAMLVLMVLGPANSVADCIRPMALWKLEESGTAPNFKDEMNPDDHIGLCRGVNSAPVCPEAVSGRYGTGQQFFTNGRLSGIDIPSSPIFNWDNTDSFSISFWMKRDNSPFVNNEVVISRDSSETDNDLHWWIGLNSVGVAEANFHDRNYNPADHSARSYLLADRLLTDNQWHFIVFVRNSATSENRLYVDGILEDKVVVSYSENAFSANSTPLNIGWIKLDEKYQYKGIVDEIALYDVALPQWFIHDRYHADQRYATNPEDPCK